MSPKYVKRIGLVTRKQSLSQEQFVAHWLNVHAELCRKLPGMVHYSVNIVDRAKNPQLDADGFSELWFESEETLTRALQSPEGKTLLADLPNVTEKIYPVLAFEFPML